MIRQVTIPIAEKVLTREDITSLAKLVGKNYVERSKKNRDLDYHYRSFEVTLKAEDDAIFKLEKAELADIDALLRERKIEKVTIRFSDPSRDSRSIDVEIEQAERNRRYWRGNNSIDISSADEDWYNARRAELSDWLEHVKSQDNLYLKHRTTLKHILAFPLGYSLLYITVSVIVLAQKMGVFPPPLEHPTPLGEFLNRNSLILTLVLSYIYGRLWIPSVLDRLDQLWPSVEFHFSEKYRSQASSARIVISYLVTVVLLPVIITIILHVFDL